uniref:Uncharacterized protein n=1 Tax=Octopus bimaculoides TaxID=37653 RepID=A0A0L8H535_OCTBM
MYRYLILNAIVQALNFPTTSPVSIADVVSDGTTNLKLFKRGLKDKEDPVILLPTTNLVLYLPQP